MRPSPKLLEKALAEEGFEHLEVVNRDSGFAFVWNDAEKGVLETLNTYVKKMSHRSWDEWMAEGRSFGKMIENARYRGV